MSPPLTQPVWAASSDSELQILNARTARLTTPHSPQAGDATTALRLSDGTRVTLRGRGGAAAGGQLIASYLSIETWGAFGARSSLHAMQV